MGSVQNHGLIATLINPEGKQFSMVFGYPDFGDVRQVNGRRTITRLPMGMQVWTRELIDFCDKRKLRIQSISTPATILADLKGRMHGGVARKGITLPEASMLGQLDRMDLFEKPVNETTLETPVRRSS